jgi:transposase
MPTWALPPTIRAAPAPGAKSPPLPVSGRERVHLNAALNVYGPTQMLLGEASCVNAQSPKHLHEQSLAAHADKARINVMCDNARYYKYNGLADKPIRQALLPPYSPTLNLLERLRKYLRQKIVHTTCSCAKEQLRSAVLGFFDRLPEFGQDLASLLTRKFHVLHAQFNS